MARVWLEFVDGAMKSLLVLLLANTLLACWVFLASASPARPALPTLDAPRIGLVSERRMDEAAGEGASILPPPPPRVSSVALPATYSRECRAWGPFAARDEAEALRQQLESTGALADLTTERVTGKRLVYVDPRTDASGSTSCAALRAKGLDCQSIGAGAYAGALSVGVFRREALARAQADRVAALGYEPHVVPWGEQDVVFGVVAWVDPSAAAAGEASGDCATIAPRERFL